MLTIEQLQGYGVNTKDGLARCMNMEKFYFRMLGMGLKNDSFDKLEKLLAEGNLEEAFEQAHALKGVMGNLAVTPIYDPLSNITESLRAKENLDYVSLYKPIKELRDKLVSEL
ncbi:MAG: Hpt domain-containing protein [Selenomonadaceae bacterium]|nr:Hpt domain-containing protein [Selenomonadaceae bacterium]